MNFGLFLVESLQVEHLSNACTTLLFWFELGDIAVFTALLAREGANNKEQREKSDVRAKDCQRRCIGALCVVEAARAELAQNISGPFLPIVYRKANVDITATQQQAATQRGGNEGKSVLVREDAFHAYIDKYILPVARRTYTHHESGMQVVYSTKFCKTIVMNKQAVLTCSLACSVRFKIFYRRSVKV